MKREKPHYGYNYGVGEIYRKKQKNCGTCDHLPCERFPSVSLSVQKENFAVKMYKKAGFEVVKDNGGELIMIKRIHTKKNERL